MTRSANLDLIAPDDVEIKTEKHKSKKRKKKILVKKKKKDSQKENNVNQFRKKVYELLEGKTANSLSSFLARPKVFTFDGKDKNEEILLVLRRHWFTNIKWLLITLVMVICPIVVPFIPILSFFPVRYNLLFVLFWYLITMAFVFEQFLSWYFNVTILTDERLIDINFDNLLNKRFAEAKIEMIQDVSSKTGGVSQTLFNYGTVLIQTAAEIPNFNLEMVPNPNLVLKIIKEMRQEEELEKNEGGSR